MLPTQAQPQQFQKAGDPWEQQTLKNNYPFLLKKPTNKQYNSDFPGAMQ